MPSPATVEAFLATVESGDHVGAIARFYAPDASMQENQEEPRVGRDGLMAHEARMLGYFDKVTTERLGPALISGDHVAIRWRFRFDWADCSVTEMEEVACQRWDGERIAEETFFYDPAQRIAKAPKAAND